MKWVLILFMWQTNGPGLRAEHIPMQTEALCLAAAEVADKAIQEWTNRNRYNDMVKPVCVQNRP